MRKKFYLTTAIDYTNDVLHIGHAYQKIVADAYARYHRLVGDKVWFLTGTDEHGQKSEKAAKAKGISPRKLVAQISQKNREQLDSLNISYDRFIRTTDPDHKKTAQEFYLKSKKHGDIYLSEYRGLYCVGCEAYVTEKDLVDGKCPYHPTETPEVLTEQNYFFRLSSYTKFLNNHIVSHPEFVQPESARKAMLSFLKQGLEDIPISRPTIKWGIPVPDDPTHVIYVWFDALINYISGAPQSFWPADLHLLGKDNTFWHTLLWPAMLKSAGYPLPKTVYSHGFFTIAGEKISKSLGNIIRPTELVKQFGADAIRYYMLTAKSLEADGDITEDNLKESYNANLANGLGNLVARVAKLCEKSGANFTQKESLESTQFLKSKLDTFFSTFRLNEALGYIWQKISAADKFINETKPWEKIKVQSSKFKVQNLQKDLKHLVGEIRQVAVLLQPFMPETSEKIQRQFQGPQIHSGEVLFPRK